ncbi:unnamed protein product [Caenorhabditis auriculariae]|uniref:TOG domain-containing protein n=1 Tax=Caenorhabditis auriculariae TaxID=2777116 RepID=A0A8S1HHA7_9PELO|nr:unnamed protein product [Caenorhabditis auriculariae]
MDGNWLALLLERNSADPLVRLKLGVLLQEELRQRGVPLHNKTIHEFCDVVFQWLVASNFKVSLVALEILQTGLDVSGDVLAPYYFDRLSSIVERLGDSKQPVRDAAVYVLLTLAYLENSSPNILMDRLMAGNNGFSHKQWLVKVGCLHILREFLSSSYFSIAGQVNALIPRICQMTSDSNSEVRDAATNTLVDIMVAGGPATVEMIQNSRLVPDQKMTVLLQRYEAAEKDLPPRNGADPAPIAPQRSIMARRSLRAPMKINFPTRLSTPPNSVVRSTNGGLHSPSPQSNLTEPNSPLSLSIASSNSSRSRSFGLTSEESNSVRRSMSSVRRPTPAKPSGTVGAVNEDDFKKAFSQVPKCQVFSPQDVVQHCESARAILEKTDEDWSKRVNALKLVRAVVLNGGKEHEKQLISSLLLLCDAMEVSIKDLRSQVCREACITCCYLLEEFGMSLSRLGEAVLPQALAQVPVSTKIMSTSGATLAQFVVRNVQTKQIYQTVVNSSSSKAKELRKQVASLVLLMLTTWDQTILQRHMQSLIVLVKSGICDADPDTRQIGRNCYHRMEEVFPQQAKDLFASLEPMRQKQLGGNASAASSSQSLNSDRGAMPLNNRLGTLGVRNNAFLNQRSSSAIDPKSVRMGMTPLRGALNRPRPGFPATSFDRSPGGTQFARPGIGIPSRGVAGAARPVATPTKKSSTSSQPGSRNGSPPRSAEHTNGSSRVPRTSYGNDRRSGSGLAASTFGSSAFDTNKMVRALSELNQNADDDFLLPVREQEFKIESARLESALRSTVATASINDRKESLRVLSTIVTDPTLPEPDVRKIGEALDKLVAEGNVHLLVQALEATASFVRVHHSKLSSWLPMFLGRLVTKMSNMMLPHFKTQYATTKTAILSSFDPQQQLTAVCKYITEPTNMLAPKAKATILQYLDDLLKTYMEHGASYNSREVQGTVKKIFQWLDDQRSAVAHPLCEEVLCDLFAVNAADFSMMFTSFDPQYRDLAYNILQRHGHSEHSATSSAAHHMGPSSVENECVRTSISSTSAQITDFVGQTAHRLGNVLGTSSPAPISNGGFHQNPSLGSVNATYNSSPKASALSNVSDCGDMQNYLNSSNGSHDMVFENTIHLAHDIESQHAYVQNLFESFNDLSREEDVKKSLLSLHNMMSEGSFTTWDTYFPRLFVDHFFEVLVKCGPSVKKPALRVLIKMCHAQASRLFDSTEMAICKVLDATVDVSDGTLLVVAEDCLRTLATHLPLSKVINCAYANLNKENVEDSRVMLTLKMLTRLFESTPADELAPILDEIAPSVVKSYDAPTSVVRKCSVFCLVSMVNKLGNAPLQPYLAELSHHKKHIIQVYVSRSKSSSATNVLSA